MVFVYPVFFIAMALLAIPVIIHLFNFRRYKKLPFSNVRFLAAIRSETQSRNKIRHWIILALRMLAIASLVAAFAYPVGKAQEAGAAIRRYILVYVDNSFSMQQGSGQANLLAQARARAIDISDTYNENDAFQLLTNDFDFSHKRWVNRSDFRRLVDNVSFSPATRDLKDIDSRIQEAMSRAEGSARNAYLISDFQQAEGRYLEGKSPKPDYGYNLWPLRAEQTSNVYIDSVWTDIPVFQQGQTINLKVRIRGVNNEQRKAAPLRLTVNGEKRPPVAYDLQANEATVVDIPLHLSTGGNYAIAAEVDDMPVIFDNVYYISFPVNASVKVLLIGEGQSARAIERAMRVEPAFRLTRKSESGASAEQLDDFDFIILSEPNGISPGLAAHLGDFARDRGNILIVPSANESAVRNYSDFLAGVGGSSYGSASRVEVGITAPRGDNPFFAGVFEKTGEQMAMPQVKQYYPLAGAGLGAIELLKLANGDAFMTAESKGAGYIINVAVPFSEDWSSLPSNSLFVPVIYKSAFFKPAPSALSRTIGKDNYITLNDKLKDAENLYYIVRDSFRVQPPQRVQQGRLSLFVENLIPTAGIYQVTAGKDESTGAQYAFNYDRSESAMRFASEAALKNLAAEKGGEVIAGTSGEKGRSVLAIHKEGPPIWKYFIWLALAAIILESLLLAAERRLTSRAK